MGGVGAKLRPLARTLVCCWVRCFLLRLTTVLWLTGLVFLAVVTELVSWWSFLTWTSLVEVSSLLLA